MVLRVHPDILYMIQNFNDKVRILPFGQNADNFFPYQPEEDEIEIFVPLLLDLDQVPTSRSRCSTMSLYRFRTVTSVTPVT